MSKILKNNQIGEILLFIIFPLFSFFYSIKRSIMYYPFSQNILFLFMGLCSLLWPPYGDLYRHNMVYFEFQEMTYSEFIGFLYYHYDFLFYLISFFFAKIGIPFEIIRFIFVFLSYKIIFFVINNYINKFSNCYKYVFFTVFFSVPFFAITLGIRFEFASFVMLLAIYSLLVRNKKIGYLYIIVSILIHYTMVMPTLLLIPILLNIKFTKKRMLFVLFLFYLFFNVNLIEKIIYIIPLPDFLTKSIIAYTSGYWGGEFLEDHSFKYLLSFHLKVILGYFILSFLLFKKNMNNLVYYSYLLLFLLVFCNTVSVTMFFRFFSFSIPVFLLAFFSSINRVSILELRVLCLVSCIGFLSQIYTNRREFEISREYKLLYPTPYIITNVYQKKWLQENIYEDGSAKYLVY